MKVRGIVKRGNIYWFRKYVSGERHCISLKTSDLSEAIRLAAQLSRTLTVQNKDTISVVAECCLRERLASGRIREKTATTSRNATRALIRFTGDVTATRITEEQARRFYSHLRQNMSDAGAQSYIRSLRSIFAWIAERHRLPFNPFKLKMKKLPKSPRRDFCSRAERDKLIANAPTDELRFILFAGFHAGLRKIEIIEARPEWFDLQSGLVHVGKTGTFVPKDSDDRTIPMTTAFKAFLLGYGLRSPYMIAPDVVRGRSEYRYDFRRPFTDYMRSQGVTVTAHTMRRTFASLLVSAGVSIAKISKWLGDEVDTVQNAYAHLIADDRDIDRL